MHPDKGTKTCLNFGGKDPEASVVGSPLRNPDIHLREERNESYK